MKSNTKTAGVLALLALISTALFTALIILDTFSAGPLVTYEQVLAHARLQSPLSTLAYLNVTFLTLVVSMLMAALYEMCKPWSQVWSRIGLVFVPVYCAFNLFAYFSQVTVVPRLLELVGDPKLGEMAEFMLRQMLQSWPDSAVSIFNNAAYAILGIPSIIFGIILGKMGPRLRVAGILLAANGVACLVGIAGITARQPLLSLGSLVGAVLFLAALFTMCWQFLRGIVSGQA